MAEGSMSFSLNAADFLKAMDKLGSDVEFKIANKSVAAGAQLYAREVRKQIPLGSAAMAAKDAESSHDATLKKSIASKKMKGAKRRGIVKYQVGVVGWARAYAHVFEYGSKYQKGTRVFTKTFENQFPQIIGKMAEVMEVEIKKHARG